MIVGIWSIKCWVKFKFCRVFLFYTLLSLHAVDYVGQLLEHDGGVRDRGCGICINWVDWENIKSNLWNIFCAHRDFHSQQCFHIRTFMLWSTLVVWSPLLKVSVPTWVISSAISFNSLHDFHVPPNIVVWNLLEPNTMVHYFIPPIFSGAPPNQTRWGWMHGASWQHLVYYHCMKGIDRIHF